MTASPTIGGGKYTENASELEDRVKLGTVSGDGRRRRPALLSGQSPSPTAGRRGPAAKTDRPSGEAAGSRYIGRSSNVWQQPPATS